MHIIYEPNIYLIGPCAAILFAVSIILQIVFSHQQTGSQSQEHIPLSIPRRILLGDPIIHYLIFLISVLNISTYNKKQTTSLVKLAKEFQPRPA